MGLAGVLRGARKPKLPNIVYILADDMGYGDVACLNKDGKIPTPNMDRLAKEGMIFTVEPGIYVPELGSTFHSFSNILKIQSFL